MAGLKNLKIEKDSPDSFSLLNQLSVLREDSPKQSNLADVMQLLTTFKSEQDAKLSELMQEIRQIKEQNLQLQTTGFGIKETMDSMIKKNDEMKEQIESVEMDNKRNIEHLGKKIQKLQITSSLENIASGSNADRGSSDNGYNERGAPMINYGVGMACSFFEGYLTHIIPSDGGRFIGFQENINVFEAKQGVVFPVKRLFIVVTKSLYCPPDLKHCNKENRKDLPYLEACLSLEDIEKDVAGVKNRTYRNSAYKIYRPGGKKPVFITAEFATPLHTLHKVLEKRAIYDKLCDVDSEEIVRDFCVQLRKIIDRSPDCRGKCELVHYDDTNKDENLADVLLDEIKKIQPDFEDIIEKNSRELR